MDSKMIQVTCPECSKPIEVPDSQAGKVETCVHCCKEMVIPRQAIPTKTSFGGRITRMMNKKTGTILILVGVGLLCLSFIFATSSFNKPVPLFDIARREIVLVHWHTGGGITVPLKYPLALSVLLILTGTGITLLSKDKAAEAKQDKSKEQQ